MGELVQVLTDRGLRRVVLVPQGLLSLLPLHAAWTKDPIPPTGRRYALDKILFTYAPNALALRACQITAATSPIRTLFAVEDPTLKFSEDEVSAVLEHFQPVTDQTALGRPAVNREEVLSKLICAAPNVLHFATHGEAGFENALQAGLTIAHGECLTLRDILQLRLKHIRLAVLSACETGIPGTELPDEIVSLPTGLVQAGVAGVVGSLWAVDDVSTLLLMRHFYDLWRNDGTEPSEALRQAQIRLRDTTQFDSPFYWAAFGYTGV